MNSIEDAFIRACNTSSDINEHLPRMRELGRECAHVTELGVRSGVSTIAWIAARPTTLVCYDITRTDQIADLERMATIAEVAFVFVNANVLDVTLEPTDLLFIDTLHTYDQLRQELAMHADKARRYILLHDTEMFGALGEIAGSYGLRPALNEFLTANPAWRIQEHHANNNGLTVLVRTAPAVQA